MRFVRIVFINLVNLLPGDNSSTGTSSCTVASQMCARRCALALPCLIWSTGTS